MGQGSSKQPKRKEASSGGGGNPICIDCQPTQKQVPEQSSTACVELYEAVDKCMREHKGQITSCSKEWQAFQACHEKEKENPRR